VTSRPLHAVLLPAGAGAGQLLAALAAALDGIGPAILPLDPALPRARLDQLLGTLAPSAIQTPEGTERISPPASSSQPPGVRADVAVVIATSGSTGEPKGVELTAAALRASAGASLARIGARPGQRWLCCLPPFHMAGLGVLVRSLLAGTDPVVADRADGGVIEAGGCAHVSLVPAQLRRLLDSGAPLAALSTILLGGAAPPPGLVAEAAAAGARVVTTYGMSETCGGCVYDGLPLDGVSVDFEADGRIKIAGPVLFSGYRLRPELTGAALSGGSFRTSDLGFLDESGLLRVRGRADDLINTGGEKVVPGEIEAVLGTMQAVRDVVIVGMPDRQWGELVTAFVVPADPAAVPGLDEVRAHVRERLPAYAAPRQLFVLPAVPLLPSGKPDRAALRELASEGSPAGAM
jgi:O-succinylbenzoic acid--CoA ligase